MSKIPIVFFGSGPVAAKSLELLMSDFEIIAVITKPRPDHHKGSFPVIDLASEKNLTVYTVSNKKDLSELISKELFKTEIAILIDFGIIVGQDVIDYFPKGIINSHFSLLPEWRGADPITFSILSGQAKTGVSLMLLVEAMDEGPLISVGIQEIDKDDTTATLTNKLIYLSDALLKNAVPKYINDSKSVDQAKMPELIKDYPNEVSYSRKLTKNDSILDFNKPAADLEREIRAFATWPKSKTKLAGIDVIITQAHHSPTTVGSTGTVKISKKEGIVIQCKEGCLHIESLKPLGKNEMTTKSFIDGYWRPSR